MCNLYRLGASREEVAAYFRSIDQWRNQITETPANYAAEIYPGYPGLVLAGAGLRAMNWGFPLAMKSRKTGAPLKPKPVNNARTDKLNTPFWRASFEKRRCLIPLTAFAEAEGRAGAMTRTWISVPQAAPAVGEKGTPNSSIFCAAGIWRWSEEWGEVYSMVMTDPCAATAEVHDRMPVIVAPADYGRWLASTPEQAFALCVPWAGEIAIERTAEPWFKRRG